MKNKRFTFYCLIAVFMGFSTISFSQSVDSSDYFNYAADKQLNYLQGLANQQDKELWELSEYREYIRWKNNFETKLDNDGKMAGFGKFVYNYYEDNSDVEGDITLDWNYNSPDSLWSRLVPKSTNGEYTNENAGQHLIIALWVNPKDTNHIMAGCQFAGGLWRTWTSGDTWSNITEDYPQIQGISSIYVNPNDTSEIYLTCTYNADGPRGYNNGLYFSNDGGNSWNLDSCYTYDPWDSTYKNLYPTNNANYSPRGFLQNFEDTTIQYLITPYRVLVSTDNGENYKIIIDKYNYNPDSGFYSIYSAKRYFEDMAFDPETPDTLYVTGPEAFKVYDNGESVENITTNLLLDGDSLAEIIYVDTHPNYSDSVWYTIQSRDTTLYIYPLDTSKKYIYNIYYYALYNKQTGNYQVDTMYIDTVVNSNGTFYSFFKPGSAYLHCEISPENPDHILIGGAIPECYEFSTGTHTRQGYDQGFHNDIRAAEWIAYNDSVNFAILGTDGGITKKYFPEPSSSLVNLAGFEYIANNGINPGIRNLDIQGFDVSHYGQDVMIIGTSHNAMILKKDGLFKKVLSGGDQSSMVIDPKDANKYYVAQYGHAKIEYTHNLGYDSDTLFNNYHNNPENPPVLFFKPNDTRRLYAGFNGLIWEFDTESIPINTDTTAVTHLLPYDSLALRYIKEVGVSEDLEDIAFVSTNRWWKYWEGWDTLPHINAMFRVELGDSLIFTDITANIDQGLSGGPITGISIELNGSDTIVYTCFGGTSFDDDSTELKKRVYYSKDLGNSWYAMADSLPKNIPANDIGFIEEKGMLFIATDVGVYYYDKIDSLWLNCTGELPSTNYKIIRYSHPRAKILIGTQAKGIWEADLPCYSDSVTVQIKDSTTWDYSRHMLGDIEIEAGAVLTVKKNVYMPTNTKVIVERGGKLIIDGGKFTNACDEVWMGIELWGNSNHPPDSLNSQGTVILKNEAIVENARYGVRTIKMVESQGGGGGGMESSPDYDYAGGKVKVYGNSTFRNCIYGVYFYPYTYTNQSYFDYVNFETTDSLMTSTGIPESLVYMNGVTGISFTGCSFFNSRDTATIDNDERGKGIYSTESYYIVDEGCSISSTNCPDSLIVPGNFEGLYYGIDSRFTSSTKYIDVRNSAFVKNWRGLYASAMDNGRITSNSFEIDQPFEEDGGCGLYLDNCSGYWVEENYFEHIGDTATGIGIVIHNSGGDANEIYRNEFYNLDHGISAQEQNNSRNTGLQILCNDFDDCLADVFVPEPQTEGYGIAPNQGVVDSEEPEDMAGNEFYYDAINNNYDDVNNEGNGLKYMYDYPSGYDVDPVDSYGITAEAEDTDPPWTPTNGCPSEITTGGGTKSSNSGHRAALEYYTVQVELMESTLEALIDGGDTETLNTEVELSTPPETMGIYSAIIGESPFVSETVIETVIEKEAVLPNSLLRDIMVANPHTANSNQLLNKLDERVVVMPNYMKAQILQGKTITTLKMELESKLADFKLKQSKALNRLVLEYLTDTLSPENAQDSVLALYQTFSDKSIQYRLALLFLARHEYTIGEDVIDDILINNDLEGHELESYNQFVEYYNILKGIKQSGREISNVTELEEMLLNNIVNADAGFASAYARNLLINADKLYYIAPIQLPDLTKSNREQEEMIGIINTKPPNRLSVFPNPAKDFLIVHYSLENEKFGIIEIRDMNGNLAVNVITSEIENQVTINTQKLATGAYIATLKIDGNTIESCIFTLIK